MHGYHLNYAFIDTVVIKQKRYSLDRALSFGYEDNKMIARSKLNYADCHLVVVLRFWPNMARLINNNNNTRE